MPISLGIEHPETGELLEFQSELPGDLASFTSMPCTPKAVKSGLHVKMASQINGLRDMP